MHNLRVRASVGGATVCKQKHESKSLVECTGTGGAGRRAPGGREVALNLISSARTLLCMVRNVRTRSLRVCAHVAGRGAYGGGAACSVRGARAHDADCSTTAPSDRARAPIHSQLHYNEWKRHGRGVLTPCTLRVHRTTPRSLGDLCAGSHRTIDNIATDFVPFVS